MSKWQVIETHAVKYELDLDTDSAVDAMHIANRRLRKRRGMEYVDTTIVLVVEEPAE